MMEQQTTQLPDEKSVSFERNTDISVNIKFGWFAAQLKKSVQTKVTWKSQKIANAIGQMTGLLRRMDRRVPTLILLALASPFVLHLATDYIDWFVATDIAQHLGTNLKPEQINLLIDKIFDVLIVILAGRSAN